MTDRVISEPFDIRLPNWGQVKDMVKGFLTPPDPIESIDRTINQFKGGDYAGAAETILTSGIPGMPGTGAIKTPGLRGWHGSKANWDVYDPSFGFSGEGVGSWGSGLYLGPKKTATFYRLQPEGKPGVFAAESLKDHDMDIGAAAQHARDFAETYDPASQTYSAWKRAGDLIENPPGYGYAIRGALDPEAHALFNLPVNEQKQGVRKAFDAIGVNPNTAIQADRALQNAIRGRAYQMPTNPDMMVRYNQATTELTNALRDAGLKSGEYKLPSFFEDRLPLSRPNEKHTVIYDPSIIDVFRKFGLGEHIK